MPDAEIRWQEDEVFWADDGQLSTAADDDNDVNVDANLAFQLFSHCRFLIKQNRVLGSSSWI